MYFPMYRFGEHSKQSHYMQLSRGYCYLNYMFTNLKLFLAKSEQNILFNCRNNMGKFSFSLQLKNNIGRLCHLIILIVRA